MLALPGPSPCGVDVKGHREAEARRQRGHQATCSKGDASGQPAGRTLHSRPHENPRAAYADTIGLTKAPELLTQTKTTSRKSFSRRSLTAGN